MQRTKMSNPIIFLNGYLAEKVPEYLAEYGSSIFNYFEDTMRFFPVSPTTIDELTQQLPSSSEAPFVVYDRMLRFKRGPFPHTKQEQLIYYFYKTTTKSSEVAMAILIETIQAVEDLLDRGDESAEEINSWIQSKLDGEGLYQVGNVKFSPVYFHETQVFHLQEVRDIIDFGTARTYAGNKLILDYAYHAQDFNPSPQKFIPIQPSPPAPALPQPEFNIDSGVSYWEGNIPDGVAEIGSIRIAQNDFNADDYDFLENFILEWSFSQSFDDPNEFVFDEGNEAYVWQGQKTAPPTNLDDTDLIIWIRVRSGNQTSPPVQVVFDYD